MKSTNQGVFITLPPFPKPEPGYYLKHVSDTIDHSQNHPNQVPISTKNTVFNQPTTAIIIGAGTIGIQAVVFATRILPPHSTIILVQNDLNEKDRLEKLLRDKIQGSEKHTYIVSDPMDIGHLDEIESFFKEHREVVKNTGLYIHAADKAERFIPDQLHYMDALRQVIRRASVAAMSDFINEISDNSIPLVRIVVSSAGCQYRDTYRIPNLGPYQVGKVVGDELFKSSLTHNNTYSFILYSGPMNTLGQEIARASEYNILKNQNYAVEASSAKDYIQKHINTPDIDAMESTGMMFKIVWESLNTHKLSPQKIYVMYGKSVSPKLGKKPNQLQFLSPPPYMSAQAETWFPKETNN